MVEEGGGRRWCAHELHLDQWKPSVAVDGTLVARSEMHWNTGLACAWRSQDPTMARLTSKELLVMRKVGNKSRM